MMRAVSWWVSVVSLGIIAIAVVARLFQQEAGPLAIVVALIPWFTLACIIPIVFAILARDVWLASIAGVLTVILVWWIWPIFTPDGGGEPVLRVASVNATFGDVDAAALVELVQTNQVDVLAVQELTPEAVAAFSAAGLDKELTFSMTVPEEGVTGSGIWSRYPMTAEKLDGYFSATLEADVVIDERDYTFFAVHPKAPGKREHSQWAADLALLAEDLDDAIGPTIVLGDFNATRDHSGFREFERLGYADAADQAGNGFQPTFPEGRLLGPLFAIDHSLERDTGLTALRVETITLPGSDHRAIVVDYGAED